MFVWGSTSNANKDDFAFKYFSFSLSSSSATIKHLQPNLPPTHQHVFVHARKDLTLNHLKLGIVKNPQDKRFYNPISIPDFLVLKHRNTATLRQETSLTVGLQPDSI